ncbi:MAG TPA: glycosyltransferase [Bacteroidales bacterium]|nr:glycosyltransferase [Bacteroidales bacterium]HPS50615.1 glycosyltransferase [Bacteroidales bacterium]
MKKKKICILTQSHLCRNPRVVKESIALAGAGFEVVILTTFTYPDLLAEDLKLIDHPAITLKGVVNMIPSQAPGWYRFKERLVRRLAGEAIARFGAETAFALGYDYRRNLNAAVREKADLYTCHQEISTVIGCKLLRRGFKVAFDFEDWYSHDLLPEANRSRPVGLLEKYEKIALRQGMFSYTTSKALANALGDFAGALPPHVLPNVFPYSDRDRLDNRIIDRKDLSIPSIHWYSQTIGPGRGLEFLVETLADVTTPVELHLRGNIYRNFSEDLDKLFPYDKGHKLFTHPLVPHNELLSRIAEHDVGLATEEYTPDSRNLTITNKILQYLQGGIAVVASDTLGQQEVAQQAPEAVMLFRNKDRNSLANLLNELLHDRDRLLKARQASSDAARDNFCWEQQAPRLISWISEILKP